MANNHNNMVINHIESEAFQILKLLIENKKEKYSIRRLSKARKINYKSAYNAIMNLKEEGIVDIEKIGNMSICSFNGNFSPLVFAVEYEIRNEALKKKKILEIYTRLDKLAFSFSAIISEKDKIIIITDREAEVKKVLSNCDFAVLSPDDFSKNKETTVKKAILFGIEEFYRLMKNDR